MWRSGGVWRRLIAGGDLTRNTVESDQVDQRVCPFLLRRRVEGAVVDEERILLLMLEPAQPQWGQLALASCEKEPDLA